MSKIGDLIIKPEIKCNNCVFSIYKVNCKVLVFDICYYEEFQGSFDSLEKANAGVEHLKMKQILAQRTDEE